MTTHLVTRAEFAAQQGFLVQPGAIVTGGTSATANPIQYPQLWDVVRIGGLVSPGIIQAINGFDRPNAYQQKTGRGSIGGTLTFTNKPPTFGSITWMLWRPIDFSNWGIFSQQFTTRPQTTPAKAALEIYHPSFADIQLHSVVVGKPDGKGGIERIRHVGKGKYLVTVHFLEFVPTPQKSAVSTVTFTNQANSSPTATLSSGSQPTAAQKAKDFVSRLQAQAAANP